ncbi:MAG TPA: hypothetical protein VK152_10105 [Paludibacter sp.]|nr:hypothetical protein [Paludibacter sp.]
MNIKLFLTFDHELPLGKLKTSYEASLFEPTQKVFKLAKELGVNVTLFTDILCSHRYKEWDPQNFYIPYKNQLQNALSEGHDVQLHTHPHWLTSKYEKGIFIPSADFGLSNFSGNSELGGISGIINLGINGLTEICKTVKPDYNCIAYRAGGFNIAPETFDIFNTLYNQGIRYDSSMSRGYYFKSGISEVDFRRIPQLSNWVIDPENSFIASKHDGILEIPIASMPKTPFEMPTMFKMKKYASRAPITHGEVIHSTGNISKIAKLNMMFSARMLTFDNYTLSLMYLMRILEYNIKKYESHETLMLSIISHPKSMGDYSFDLMKGFVNEVHKRYPHAEFLTYSRLHQTM